MIYVINYNSTRKFAMKTNGGFLRSYFTTCMNRAHLVQAQYSIKWSAIYEFLLEFFMCISYEYSIWGVSYIHMNMGLRSCGFTRWVYFNVPDPGTILDGTVHALRLHCVPPCLSFILDRQRKLTVFHEYIVPYTPLFHCTVHNFGRLTCVSPKWNRPKCEHVTTPWRHHYTM